MIPNKPYKSSKAFIRHTCVPFSASPSQYQQPDMLSVIVLHTVHLKSVDCLHQKRPREQHYNFYDTKSILSVQT